VAGLERLLSGARIDSRAGVVDGHGDAAVIGHAVANRDGRPAVLHRVRQRLLGDPEDGQLDRSRRASGVPSLQEDLSGGKRTHAADEPFQRGPAPRSSSRGSPRSEVMARRRSATPRARSALSLSWGAPFVMGVVLGVPLVSRELEHRTAGMAWTLSRSRTIWLAGRVAFLGLVLIGLLVVVAVASEVLASALLPTASLDSDFTWYGRRGGLIVARGVASLGLSVLVGAALGRLGPGLAAFASVLVFTALSVAMDRWVETDAVLLSALNGNAAQEVGDRSLGTYVRLINGEVIPQGKCSRVASP
jgi:hypothetical protein